MSHPDDETIAAAALGESLDVVDAKHVQECTRCAAQLRDLEELATRLKTMDHPASLLVPPSRVWDAVVAELGTEDGSLAAETPPHVVTEPLSPRTPEMPADRLASVTPIRRFSTGWLIASAAAVGLVIGGVGVTVVSQIGSAQPTVVASASLTHLATDTSAGTARVEDRSDGTRVLVVDTDYEATPGGDLEVWLIDPRIEGMVSVGFLVSSQGEFVIPVGYDPGDYPIVDISLEPRDGVPTHSGDSITRGLLGL